MSEKKQRLDRAVSRLNKISGIKLEYKDISDEDIEDAISRINAVLDAYNEKYSLSNIVYKILLGDLSYKDFSKYKQDKYFPDESKYCLYLLQTKSDIDSILFEILSSLFPDKRNDYLVQLDKNNLAIIHNISCSFNSFDIKEMAASIQDVIGTEAMISAYISYSRIFDDLFSLSEIYKESKLALKINSIFYPNRFIVNSDRLSIGRLIYSLPKDTCKAFLIECFGENAHIDIDDETRHTIDTFFRNNLNIAETARQLHMHRNTLVYRLEQIEKLTDMPIRSFEGAMKFNIAVMIMNFLQNDF